MNLEAVIQFAVDNGALDDDHLRETIELFNRESSQKYICPETSELCGVCKQNCMAQPEPSPEWMTEEEQTAYTFGWFKALESQRMAQPAVTESHKQEHVAWESILGAIARGWCYEENANKTIDKDLAEAIAKEVYALFYTTPPQRKPLTDEQIDSIADKFTVHTGEMWEPELCIEFNDSCKSVHSFARAIESAHGIKE